MPQAEIPQCLSLILCEALFTCPTTGKLTLLGVVDIIHAKEYPATYPSMVAFVELTNGRGEVEVSLKVCRTTADAVEGEVVLRQETPTKISFDDPRELKRVFIDASPISFQDAGEYRFVVEANGEFVAERRLLAIVRNA